MNNIKWIDIRDGKPNCYQTGRWDGKRSDLIICVDANEEINLAYCYEGVLDGVPFFDWYDKNDFKLVADIAYWSEIPLPW